MFGRGVVLGLTTASVLALAFIVYQSRYMEAMYRDFGNAPLPALTGLVLGTPWKVGALGLSIATVIVLARRRPAPLLPYVAAFIGITGAMIATYYGLYMPLWQVAGAIR